MHAVCVLCVGGVHTVRACRSVCTPCVCVGVFERRVCVGGVCVFGVGSVCVWCLCA